MAAARQILRPVYLLLAFPRVRIHCPLVLRYQNRSTRKLYSVLSGKARFYKKYVGYNGCSSRHLTATTSAYARTQTKRTARVKKELANEEEECAASLGMLASDDEKPKRRSRRTKAEIDAEVNGASELSKKSSCGNRLKSAETESEKPKRKARKTLDPEVEPDKKTASEKPKRKSRKSKVETVYTGTDGSSDSEKPRRKRRSKKVDGEAQIVVTSKDDKPKKRTRQKKEVVEEVETLEPSFPFEGTFIPDTENKNNSTEYSAANDEFGTLSNINSIKRMDTTRGRFYHITTAKGEVCFPSVTTVLKQTMSRESFFRLHTWRKNMIKEHGVKGFETISREVKQSGTNFHQDLEARLLQDSAQEIAVQASLQESADTSTLQENADTTSSLGENADTSSLHKNTGTSSFQKTVSNSWKLLPSNIKRSTGFMQSVEHVLKDISDVLVLEGTVAHYELGYTGTFDCVAKYRGELCLIDWKTSGKPRPSLSDCYEYPLQAVAYAGAINDDPRYSFKVNNALIVVVYPSGEPAHAHFLSHKDCLTYWTKWLKRLQEYQTQSSGDLSNVYFEI